LVDRLGEAAGNIVDAVSGEVLGQHRGTFTVTIGQRRGLDLRVPAEDGTPRYVVDIDMETRNVIVGSPDLLDVHAIEATHPIWCGASLDSNSRELLVQVRAHSDPVPAQVRFDGETVRVELIDPIRGLAPGQTVAIFDGTRVVGSATIDATDRIAAREPLASTRQ
jgi:tRNA-specific 2-thiouridylase